MGKSQSGRTMLEKDPNLDDLIDYISNQKQDKNPQEIQSKYLRLTEERNALDYLEKAYDYIRQVEKDEWAWKWVILALHSALYGFAICASMGSSSDWVAPVIKKGKNKGQRQLISIGKALEFCQNPSWMKIYVHSKHLTLSKQQEESIDKLKNWFRDEFEHYKPVRWSIELHGMPQICIDVLEVIRFLALETGNCIHLTQTQIKKIGYIVTYGKRMLERSQLYKEFKQEENN
ncbi:MAG TPA: hypothetical protein VNN20_06390 [Thermodesulfobacteriota bacterium]|nr:hypothetical protein [Thermodesulfobacteriota bacterium]